MSVHHVLSPLTIVASLALLAVLVVLSTTATAQDEQAKQLLIRCDDVGMSHTVNMAVRELLETGMPFSTSVMIACPWYLEAVEILKANPQIGVGIHLTLNSEWKDYKWGPVSGAAAVPSLVDENGHFYASEAEFAAADVSLEEVEMELRAQIERALRAGLRVDYLDSLLMHCMTRRSWPADMRPVMDVLQEAKQKGRVRAVGISCHGWDPLVASVDCDWIDVQLVRINPFGSKMDGQPEDVAAQLKKMHEKGRGVIGMKIYGEDGLGTQQRRLQSLKYVLGLGSVDAFTIGFGRTEQIDETLSLIEKALA